MTEERITETTTPSGETHTTHTVITDRESGGGGKWVLLLLVLAIAIVGVFFLTQMSGAEVAKDNAVANAANEVGDAASQVGDAAQNAGEAVQDAVQQ